MDSVRKQSCRDRVVDAGGEVAAAAAEFESLVCAVSVDADGECVSLAIGTESDTTESPAISTNGSW